MSQIFGIIIYKFLNIIIFIYMKAIREKTKQIKEEYEIKYSIFKILNTLGEFSIKNYTPLKIDEDDYHVLIDLTKERLRYIKETIEYNYKSNVLGIFATFAFKSLFIGTNDLKIEEINQKITYFNFILEYADTEKIDPKLQEIIKCLEKNINDKEKKLFKKIFTNDIIYFIYLLLKRNQTNLLDINKFLVRVVESGCHTDKDFEYDVLTDIPNENIIDDLYKIFFVQKITNNFHLHIDNRHIKVNKFTNDELADYINSPNTTEKIKNENKSKNSGKIKEITKKSNIDDKPNPQKNKELEKQIEIMQRQINELYDYKAKINSLNLQMTNNNTEIYRIKSDLKLIKLSRSLKVFVNYLYIGLNLKGGFDYESKITKIIEKLKTFTHIKYNKKLVEDTINFMKEFYDKIELGNFSDHNLDLKVSILDQIFELIDKENKAGELKSKLKNETNADIILKNLIKNREDNYFNKTPSKSEEKKINKCISDLSSIWLKIEENK